MSGTNAFTSSSTEQSKRRQQFTFRRVHHVEIPRQKKNIQLRLAFDQGDQKCPEFIGIPPIPVIAEQAFPTVEIPSQDKDLPLGRQASLRERREIICRSQGSPYARPPRVASSSGLAHGAQRAKTADRREWLAQPVDLLFPFRFHADHPGVSLLHRTDAFDAGLRPKLPSCTSITTISGRLLTTCCLGEIQGVIARGAFMLIILDSDARSCRSAVGRPTGYPG